MSSRKSTIWCSRKRRATGSQRRSSCTDGKHISTGGGNHIVIGGTTVADSPMLRRPDLLRSMVTFWQNHPALSYLFSGRFIGPTSQHPRVDEARMDALYELEIAFSLMPEGECPPWLVDRLFRNLLVDMTGNTHRAEFCIDKLYPPEGSGSRLGLLELRAFEMAPQVRMGLTELLLVRALVAMFWKQPYPSRLVRWGTGIHDRFLLPHFVKQDFFDVLTVLQRFGYAFDEQCSPLISSFGSKIGSIAVDDVELELRQALEPWHVLGEEASSGSTSRSVDSSLERLQVKVTGLTESRYVVSCNGRRVPLHATGKPGEAVAGVRYRAWQPPSCLHPTIPVHTPLRFDIIDLWNARSVGGCAFHVIHPDGRWYETRPVDAADAESRRNERFQDTGGTPGVATPPQEERNPSFPMTLDLRWPGPGELSRVGARPKGHDFRPAADCVARSDCLRRVVGGWCHAKAALVTPDRLAAGDWAGRTREALEPRRTGVRENAITYNIYSDPLGVSRPWRIDLIPLLIPASEWRYIEAGVIQRAQLLNQVLEDVYGPQKLLAGGHIPAALVYANPAFLRPLAGIDVPKQTYLHLLAVDLARSPDGQWWVLADRTQAPSGAGYALENRTLVADVLPDLFRASNVQRLARSFARSVRR